MFGPHLPFGLLASIDPERFPRHPRRFGAAADAVPADGGNSDLPARRRQQEARRGPFRLRPVNRTRRKQAA